MEFPHRDWRLYDDIISPFSAATMHAPNVKPRLSSSSKIFQFDSMLPDSFIRMYSFVVCLLNLLVILVTSIHMYLIGGLTQLLLVTFALLLALVLYLASLFTSWRTSSIVSLWSLQFIIVNATMSCIMHPNALHCHQDRPADDFVPKLRFVARRGDVPMYLTWAWLFLTFLRCFRLPKVPPSTRVEISICICLTFCMAQIIICPILLLKETSCFKMGFATANFSIGCLMVVPVMINEMTHFLRTGDGTGCRALLLVPVAFTVTRFVGLARLGLLEKETCLVMALAFGTTVSLHVATSVREDVCSSSPLYVKNHTRENSRFTDRLHDWTERLRTWRAINLAYMVNATVSLFVYGFFWDNQGMRQVVNTTHTSMLALMPLHMGDGKRHLGRETVLGLASISVLAVAANVLIDWSKVRGVRDGCWLAMFWPTDRHFRFLTVLKVNMLLAKVDMLLCQATTLKGLGGPTKMEWLQIFSIVSTFAMASLSVISMFGVALSVISFSDVFRFPRILWRATMASVLLLHACGAALLLTKDNAFLSLTVLDTGWAGVLLGWGSVWFLAANEVALFLSSRVSWPRVFAALQSPRGVRALVTYIAITLPMSLLVSLMDFISFCPVVRKSLQPLHVSFYMAVFTFLSLSFILLCGLAIMALGSSSWHWERVRRESTMRETSTGSSSCSTEEEEVSGESSL